MNAATQTASNGVIFDFLFGDRNKVYVRGMDKGQTPTSVRTHRYSDNRTWEQGYDIYFPVNREFNKRSVSTYYAVWVDLDTPKIDDKYADLGTVAQHKVLFHDKVDSFPLRPTYIVETRNGVQVLWAIEPMSDASRWSGVIGSLCSHFDADETAIEKNQLLRVPNSTWYKTHTGLDPYDVQCTYFNEFRYDIGDVEKVLTRLGTLSAAFTEPESTQPQPSRKSSPPRDPKKESSPPQPDNPKFVLNSAKRGDVPLGLARRRLIEIEIKATKEYTDSEAVLCPFHDDNSASATRNGDGSIYCHAEKRRYSAVEVLAEKLDVPVIEAVADLAESLDVNVPGLDVERLREAQNRIQKNVLSIPALLHDATPVLDRFFKANSAGPAETLDYLVCLFLSKFDINETFDADENPVVFVSSRKLGEHIGVSKTKAVAILRILALLGLIRPMPVREFPKLHAQRLIEWKEANNRPSIPFHVGLPDYTDPEWQQMFAERVELLAPLPLQQRLLTFDAILTLTDPDTAAYVYPEVTQYAHKKGRRRAVADRDLILKIIDEQIEMHGFAREIDVIDQFVHQTLYKKRKQSVAEYKYNLPLLLWDYPYLERRQLTKKEKKALGVDWNWGQAVVVLPSTTDKVVVH